MKLFVSTVGSVDATKKAISNADLTDFIKAVAGKSMSIDVTPDTTIVDLVSEVKRKGDISSDTPVSSVVILKGKSPVFGSTVGACGLTDGATIIVKFVHKTS
jgi:hypothetical protein